MRPANPSAPRLTAASTPAPAPQIAKIAHPTSRAQRRRLELVHAAHRRFCERQLENDKTRRVLEAAFGADLAAAYMREMMFDCPEQLELPAS